MGTANDCGADEAVRFVIPLPPYTKKNSGRILYKRRPGGGKTPFIAPSDQYVKYERDCMYFIKPLGIDYPVNVKASFYMGTRRHVDLTNLNEALHDILVAAGALVDDNASILVSSDGSRVFYDKENPRTEVVITPEEKTFMTAQDVKKAKEAEKREKEEKKRRKVQE